MAQHNDEPPAVDPGGDKVMGLLSEHVPLSLIVDLSAPQGPDSKDILTSEGVPEDSWWVQVGADATADAELEDAETDEDVAD